MNMITRFNRLDDPFEDLFRGFFVRPVALENEAPAQFRVDVKENDADFVVHAEIPGVRKEDIQVTIDGNQVAISAEVKRQSEEKKGERVLRSERYYGRTQRAFTLSSDVDSGAARARYSDGVLELTLPKKSTVAAKRIAVQ